MYYDASVKDVVDAMEVILNKRFFGSRPLYARKIVCADDANSYIGNDLAMAIKFAKKPEDFEAYETENNSFVIETFPTICGIWENNEKAGDTLWEFAERLDLDQYRDKDDKRSTFYCKHGVDVAKTYTSHNTYFLSFPEYRFQLDCFAEAVKKAQTILERRMGTSKKKPRLFLVFFNIIV